MECECLHVLGVNYLVTIISALSAGAVTTQLLHVSGHREAETAITQRGCVGDWQEPFTDRF